MPATIQTIQKPTRARALDTSTSYQNISQNFIVNGTFDTDANWGKIGDGITIDDSNNNKCVFTTDGGNQALYTLAALWSSDSMAGKMVRLKYQVVTNSDGIILKTGGYSPSAGIFNEQVNLVSTVGYHEKILQVRTDVDTGDGFKLYLWVNHTTGETLDIDNVELYEVESFSNNNHGQIYSGRALEFDGVTDYFQHNGGTALSGVNQFADNVDWTFACWMNTNSSGEQLFVGNDNSTQPHLLIEGSGDYLAVRADDTDYFRFSETALELNTWYRVVYVASSNTITAYVNGVKYGDTITTSTERYTGTGSAPTTFPGSAMEFSGWGCPYGSTRSLHFSGMMSDGQVWDAAWTADDVLYDYNNPEQLALNRGGTSLTNSNLKIWYPMNDGHRGQQSYILDASNTGLGDEMVTNWNNNDFGSLSSSGSDVTSAVSDGSGNHEIYADSFSDIIGTSYKVTFTIGGTPGANLKFMLSPHTHLGSNEFVSDTLSSGSYTLYFNSDSTATKYVGFRSVSQACDFSVSDFSLKPINQKNHATTVFYGDEIAVNGDCEVTDPTTVAIGSVAGAVDDATFDDSTTVAHAGSKSLKVTGDSSSTYPKIIWADGSDMGLVKGRTYYVECWAYIPSGNSLIDFCQLKVNSNGSSSVLLSATTTVQDTWTKLSGTFVDDDIANIQFIGADNSGSAGGAQDFSSEIFYMDDLSIKEVGIATGWTDADQQLDIPQTALQSYNQLLWSPAGAEDNTMVSVADNSNLDVDDKDFSLSCWIYPVTESDYLPIWRKGAAGAEGYALVVNSSNYISLNLNDGSSHNSYVNLTDAVVPSGKWSHVVVTCDRDSATGIKCYLNGELQTANDDPTGENEDIGNSSFLRILAFSEDDDDSFSGTATEFMLFKDSILTQTEVNELYNDGKALDGTTHSLFSTKCTAYYRNNGLASWSNLATVADSGATTTAAAAGAVTHGSETMLITAGADGSRDSQGFLMNRQRATNSLNSVSSVEDGVVVHDGYVEVGGSVQNSDVFSISCWIKSAYLGQQQNIIDNREDSTHGWFLYISTGNEPSLKIHDGSDTVTIQSGTAITVDTWHHIVVTYAGGAGALKMYVDGKYKHTITATDVGSMASAITSKTPLIGVKGFGTSDNINGFNGQIDDVLLYTKVLSDGGIADEADAKGEIARIYNAGKRSHK